MLIHNPNWPNFIKHYWLSFIWLIAAIATLLTFAIATEQALNSPILFVPIVAGIFRALRRGWRPDQEMQQEEGCAAVSIQFVVAVALWPFVEVFNQLRFLWRARSIWPGGQILVNEKGRPVRSA